MTYVDVWAGAAPLENRDAYAAHAEKAAAIFKDLGALDYYECWGANVPEGEVTSFPRAVQRQDGEEVFLGFCIWVSEEARNAAIPKAMERMQSEMDGPPPFDGKRMIFGGFEALLKR